MKDLLLFVHGESEGADGLYGFVGSIDGPVRAEEDVVGADFAHRPDKFGLNGRSGVGGGDGGYVEPDVVDHA